MATIYIDTGGASTNSGTSDQNSANWSGSNATVAASTVTLDGSPDLSTLATDGSQAIYLAQATNTNQKIFWVTGADNTAKTVTVSVAPTGVTGSNWTIGGRMVWTESNFRRALRAGDTVQLNNTPASQAGAYYQPDSNTVGSSTGGFIKLVGKAGTRPVLNTTGTVNVIQVQNNTNYIYFENLELDQDGASGTAFNFGNNGSTQLFASNIKVSDAGGIGVSVGPSGSRLFWINGEVGGVGGDGFNLTTGSDVINCYIHDCAGDGIENLSTGLGTWRVLGCIIETNTGRGLYQSGSSSAGIAYIEGNTIALNGNSGLETADADISLYLQNNIFYNNGDAAGEYNVELAAAAELIGWHGYNCFHDSGAGDNLSNLTANSTEITSDPLFVDSASGDYRLKSGSPCRRTAYPGAFVGGPTAYKDMGAVQALTTANLLRGRL